MTEERKRELVREAFTLVNGRDPHLERTLSCLTPDAEIGPESFAERWRAGDGLQGMYDMLDQVWDENRAEIEAMEAIGDRLLVTATVYGRSTRGSVEISQPYWYLAEFEDDRISDLTIFATREAALDAT